MRLTFRTAVVGLMFGLAGCYKSIPSPVVTSHDAEWMALVPTAAIDPQYLPYELDNSTGEPAGTVVIDTPHRFLYLVEGNGKAIRYGVAVGDEAFKWSGVAEVGAKKEWPGWLPPADMIARWPHLKPVVDAGGLKGGPDNPFGRSGALPLPGPEGHALSHPRHQRTRNHRPCGLVRMHPDAQYRRDRPLRAGPARRAGGGEVRLGSRALSIRAAREHPGHGPSRRLDPALAGGMIPS